MNMVIFFIFLVLVLILFFNVVALQSCVYYIYVYIISWFGEKKTMIEISYNLINGLEMCTLLESYEGYLDGDKQCLVLQREIRKP